MEAEASIFPLRYGLLQTFNRAIREAYQNDVRLGDLGILGLADLDIAEDIAIAVHFQRRRHTILVDDGHFRRRHIPFTVAVQRRADGQAFAHRVGDFDRGVALIESRARATDFDL